jgi:HEPN domain-containing protein
MITSEDSPADWYLLAQDKLNAADAVFETLGPTFSCVELLHEAVERFLKGYLVSKGWRLVRTHDLTDLVASAADFDAGFRMFEELAEELTEQFFLQHYPGNDLTDVGKNYVALRGQADELLKLIRQ